MNYANTFFVFILYKYITKNILIISDINKPYNPIWNRLNINNVSNLIDVVIIVTFIVYFA